ncbi:MULTISPECIES: CoA transferase [unclassified Chelatococcus]|uniref:CaiB/BaiF CoA transferase family protein n=1 Tax=unclassified Chelatococcus TaxID=2638111 RepID=UPI001BCBD4CA|nr:MULTISPECIES: CoA transferase [unclassified Chelatococcus]MBS7701219.1 CoA transferase [Chelatococcus sp. YT9]MBX3557350.1 CoA transferase [Chelatococcus sp.]
MTQSACGAQQGGAEISVLAGLRVLDFSRYIAGPYCASILGDLGAEVIRIEPVGGGEDRKLVPVTPRGDGALFLQLNRNKKSVALDTASEQGRKIMEALIRTADVVVTNMPVNALARYGLDYPTLRALKRNIIATNLSAFGIRGPLSMKTGFDAVAQGMSGAAFLGGQSEHPSRSASSYVDYGTGLAGAVGTLAALIHRSQTGEGQNVQASLLATAMTFINAAHIEAAATGVDRKPFGNRSPFSAPSDLFPTQDGSVAVQVVGNAMFRRWSRLVGRPELPSDPRFASDSSRGRNSEPLSQIMSDWTAMRTSSAAIAALEEAGIPAGPVLSPRQAITDPQIAASGALGAAAITGAFGTLPVANLLVQLDGLAPSLRAPAPGPGEHTIEILQEIGVSADRIAALMQEGFASAPEGAPA